MYAIGVIFELLFITQKNQEEFHCPFTKRSI